MISEPILEVPGIIYKIKLPDAEFFICDDPRSQTVPLVMRESMWWPKLAGLPLKTIVDLGANVGFFSFYMNKLFPGVTIHACEPVEMTANNFELGLKLNLIWNTKLHRTAIGNNVTKLYIHIENSGSAGAYNHLNSRVPLHEVPTQGSMTLEEFFKDIPHCDLLKVDIEGGEYVLFDGFTQAHKIDRLFLETHLFQFANEDVNKERAILWPFLHKLISIFEGKPVWIAVPDHLKDEVRQAFPQLTVL